MLIEITDFHGEVYQYELAADVDLELWLMGYTWNGNKPTRNLKIVEFD